MVSLLDINPLAPDLLPGLLREPTYSVKRWLAHPENLRFLGALTIPNGAAEEGIE